LGRKKVPDALRAAGVEVRVHDELFPQGTEDVVWLNEAGAHDWVVITRDNRIRYNQLEKEAVLAARLRFFSVTSSSLTGDEAAALLVSALGSISRLSTTLKAWLHCENIARSGRKNHREGKIA
jgi:hypothetical protein